MHLMPVSDQLPAEVIKLQTSLQNVSFGLLWGDLATAIVMDNHLLCGLKRFPRVISFTDVHIFCKILINKFLQSVELWNA